MLGFRTASQTHQYATEKKECIDGPNVVGWLSLYLPEEEGYQFANELGAGSAWTHRCFFLTFGVVAVVEHFRQDHLQTTIRQVVRARISRTVVACF